MEIIKERDMKLLSRKRVILMTDNNGSTPSRQELKKAVALKFKVKEDLVIIKHVYQQFGKNKTKVIAHIYNDKNKKDAFEHKSLLKKHEDKIVEPKEAPKEETPKEEPQTEEEAEEKAEEEVDKKLEEASEEKVEEEKPAEKVEEKKDDK